MTLTIVLNVGDLMANFVILEHDFPKLHWDLMVEMGDVLWTWRLPIPLEYGTAVSAERTFDHRLLYLDYEGAISGGRGIVRRIDRGSYEVVSQTSEQLIVRLRGAVWAGTLCLERVDGDRWQATLEPLA
jgi:hypothetical protein